jgi:predicted small metal-binding protein
MVYNTGRLIYLPKAEIYRDYWAAESTRLPSTLGRIKQGVSPMLKFACKDLGFHCNYIAIGANKEMVLKKAIRHGENEHSSLFKKLNRAQKQSFSKQVETVIKEA